MLGFRYRFFASLETMKKSIIFSLLAVSAFGFVLAENSNSDIQQKVAKNENFLKKTGGFVEVEAKGPAIVVLNLTGDELRASKDFVKDFSKITRQKIVEKSVKSDKPLDAARDEIKSGAFFVIAVGETCTNAPLLSVYPEERITVINTLKISGEPANDSLIRKEMWRSYGFLSGTGYANYPSDVMQPVFSTAELRALPVEVVQPLTIARAQSVADKFGVKRSRKVPYRIAVRDGFAQAPTNDFQKAVWEDEKAKAQNRKNNPSAD